MPSDTISATLDVTAVYTNIPHDEGAEACRAMLDTRQVLQLLTEDLVHLIKLDYEKIILRLMTNTTSRCMGRLWVQEWLRHMLISS